MGCGHPTPPHPIPALTPSLPECGGNETDQFQPPYPERGGSHADVQTGCWGPGMSARVLAPEKRSCEIPGHHRRASRSCQTLGSPWIASGCLLQGGKLKFQEEEGISRRQ